MADIEHMQRPYDEKMNTQCDVDVRKHFNESSGARLGAIALGRGQLQEG